MDKETQGINETHEGYTSIGSKWPKYLHLLRFAEDTRGGFAFDKFFDELEDLEWSGKNDMTTNVIFGAFDTGLLMGFAFRDVIEEAINKFNTYADDVIEKEMKHLKDYAKDWNERGRI